MYYHEKMNNRGIYGFKKYVFIEDNVCYMSGSIPVRVTNDNCCFLDGWKIPMDIIKKLEYDKSEILSQEVINIYESLLEKIKSKSKENPERGIRKIIIDQYDFSDNFIARHESISMAAESAGVSRQSIMRCLNGKSKQSAGFIWRQKKNELNRGVNGRS